MSTPLLETLQRDLDIHRIRFLTGELAMGFTFTLVAGMHYDDGYARSAKRSIAYAEEVYATVLPLLSDPKFSKRLSADSVTKFTSELQRIREGLDELSKIMMNHRKLGRHESGGRG